MFNGNLEIAEPVLFKERGFPYSGFNQRLRGSVTVLFKQTFIERTSIHTDADRGTVIGSHLGDLFYLVIKFTNVTGIHTHRAASGFNSRIHVLGLKVNIRDHRNIRLLCDDG